MAQLLAGIRILTTGVELMDKGELFAAFFIGALIVLGAIFSDVRPCGVKWGDDGLRIKCEGYR